MVLYNKALEHSFRPADSSLTNSSPFSHSGPRNYCSTLNSLNPTSRNSTCTQGPTVSISLAWFIPSSLEPSGRVCDVTKDRISFVSKAESYPRLHYFPCLSVVDRRLILNWLVRQLFRTEKPLVRGWGIWQHMSVASLPSCWLWQPLITFSWNCCLRGGIPWVLLGLCNIYREKVWVWNISWLFQGSLTFSWWLLPDDGGEVSLQEWGWLSCRQCISDSAVAAVPESGCNSGAHRASAPLSDWGIYSSDSHFSVWVFRRQCRPLWSVG